MKFEKNIIMATLALTVVMLFGSIAFADGCCDCDVEEITVETTYSGSGQYCMQTIVPTSNGFFTDSVGADANNYNGYQYVTSDGVSAMSYDEANVSGGGIIGTSQTSYYQEDDRLTITTFGSCVTNNGTLGAFVYVQGTHNYGTLGAYGNGFMCIEFNQISYLNDTFDYAIKQGAGTSNGGQVYGEYESFENEAWGSEAVNSNSGLYWTDIETSQSLDVCDEFSTDWMTNKIELSNNGTASLQRSINASGNSTYTYYEMLNPRTTTTSSTTTTIYED